MSGSFKKITAEKDHGFTLIELIVVIIIVGILAAIGMGQYSRMVEKGRLAEAKMVIGSMRNLAYEYNLTNGSFNGMASADVNVGAASDQIPGYPNCRNTHYFSYWAAGYPTGFLLVGVRCTSGGKTPNVAEAYSYGLDSVDFGGASEAWMCNTSGGWGGTAPCP